MSYLVGIDLGSTSLKTIIYDLDGHAVAQGSRPTELVHPDPAHPDWAIWQPDQIWHDVAESLKEVTARIKDTGEIKAVAVTGMGMDGVPLDKDGRWLYPFISWHCPRTVPQQQWWNDCIGAERQFAITGNPIWPFHPALRLLWMREHEPAIFAKTDKWLLIEDFVNFMLCGVRATDYSMASNTLLFDQRKHDYSAELLKLSDIDRALLADPKPSGTVLGAIHKKAAAATGLREGTPLVLGGQDFLCGMLPVGAFRTGIVLDVVGTWEIITLTLDKPVLTSEVREMGWWVDSHVARDKYVATGSAVAADMLEWFRKNYGFEEAQKARAEGGVDWDHLMAQAQEAPPGADGVMFLPHMSGATIPVIDPSSMGAFVGLRNVIGKGHMLRAIIEGLNYQLLQIISGMESTLGVQADKFIAIGGGVNNAFWMQAKADIVGKPFETPQVEEATPLGAAILAGIGVGLYRDEQEAFQRVYRSGRVYEPDLKQTAQYAERFAVFQRLYPALKDIHAQLRKLV